MGLFIFISIAFFLVFATVAEFNDGLQFTPRGTHPCVPVPGVPDLDRPRFAVGLGRGFDGRGVRRRAADDLLTTALWFWMPVYLFLAQKRLYGQGWTMTTVKYLLAGTTYFFMMVFGLAGLMIATILTA